MKTSFFILFCFVSFFVQSQKNYINFHSGIQANNVSKIDMENLNSFSFEVNYEHFIKSKLILSLGVGYDKKGYKSSFEDNNYTFRYNYISIPLKVGFSFGNRLFFNPKLGVATSILVSYKNNYNYDAKINKKDVYFPLLLEPEIGYQITDKIDFSLIGSYKYGLNSFIKKSNIKHISYGCLLGIKYKL